MHGYQRLTNSLSVSYELQKTFLRAERHDDVSSDLEEPLRSATILLQEGVDQSKDLLEDSVLSEVVFCFELLREENGRGNREW